MKMCPIDVRTARPDDASAISELIHSLIRFALADPEAEPAEGFLNTVSASAIGEYLSSERYLYHVAEVDGRLAGVVGVRDGSHLYHLFVDQQFHGQGVGGRLWQKARAAAEAAGPPECFTVNSSIYGIPIYRKFGFEPEGELTEKDGVAFQPMRLSLA